MKIRIEGTQKEIGSILERWVEIGIPTNDIQKTFKPKGISKFYPNRVDSTALLNGLIDTQNPVGRVYIEIE